MLSNGSNQNDMQLRFNLTHAQLKALENMRHEPGRNLYLYLEPVIVGDVYEEKPTYTRNATDQTVSVGDEWSRYAGVPAHFAFYWLPTIGTLRLNLAKMEWVTAIFPGMGYDNLRLIEVKITESGARLIPEDALGHFKKAMQNYDRGLYEESLRECRLVHEAVENELETRLSTRLGKVYKLGKEHKLGEAVALDLGWTPGSEQEKFVEGAWKPLYVMANASAHTPSTKSLLPADAHVVLILTAALLEYLAELE